jgi:hypothetical protein
MQTIKEDLTHIKQMLNQMEALQEGLNLEEETH